MIISVCWIENGTLVLKWAYWWLRQTYWSGWRGKGAREALGKTTWALQWWREHPPTAHPPGPVPLWAHSTRSSQYGPAGGAAVYRVDPRRLRNVLQIRKSHAGSTVIGLVTQLLNDSEISAHSVKSVDVQTLKSKVKECLTGQPKVIHVTQAINVSMRQAESTSSFHRFDAFLHKTRDRGLLLCAQCGQLAAKHIVWGKSTLIWIRI